MDTANQSPKGKIATYHDGLRGWLDQADKMGTLMRGEIGNPVRTRPAVVHATGLLKGIAGCAEVWRALDACGIPDVPGVWNHEAGPATRFTVVQIKQRYLGHARNVLHIASNCSVTISS